MSNSTFSSPSSFVLHPLLSCETNLADVNGAGSWRVSVSHLRSCRAALAAAPLPAQTSPRCPGTEPRGCPHGHRWGWEAWKGWFCLSRVVGEALFWEGFCSTLETANGSGCSPLASVAAIPQKKHFLLFPSFLPHLTHPSPCSPSRGQKGLAQQQLIPEEHTQGTRHPCSGLLPGLEGAAGMETWGEGC